MSKPQIELLLALRVSNTDRGSDFLRALHGLIPSINHYCDPAFVARLSVVVPKEDATVAGQLAQACNIPVRVIVEDSLLPIDQIGEIPRRGWFLQQMIKLAYSKICETDFYITLDADTFLVNPLNLSVLKDGKAPAQYEPTAAHAGWWGASAATLEHPLSAIAFDADRGFGVTPAFLRTETVRATIDRLNNIALKNNEINWVAYLCSKTSLQNDCWTEYSLYWTHLINTQPPENYYYPYQVYIFSHDTHKIQKAISNKNSYPYLFCIIQSSYVSDGDYVNFVDKLFETEDLQSRRAAAAQQSGDIIHQKQVIQNTYEQRYLRSAIRKLLPRLPKQGAAADFGAGYGRLTPILEEFFDIVIGLECDQTLIDVSRVLPTTFHMEKIDKLSASFLETAQVCLSFSCTVLQHMLDEDMVATLAEMRRVTQGGFVILIESTIPGYLHGEYGAGKHFTKGRSVDDFANAMAPWTLDFVRPRYMGSTNGASWGSVLVFRDPSVGKDDTIRPDGEWETEELRWRS